MLFDNSKIEKNVDVDGDSTPDITVRYAYDGWKPGDGFIGNENWDVWGDFNSSDTLVDRYVRGDTIDQLFARIDDSGDPYWLLTDHLGSVRDVVDNTGTVVKTVAYDGYGNIISQSGSGSLGRYAWTGREIETETGLQYNRARYYNPSIGRWTSQDPLGFDAGDTNLYRYVNNAPTMGTDPSGLQQLIGQSNEGIIKDIERLRLGAAEVIGTNLKEYGEIKKSYALGSLTEINFTGKEKGIKYRYRVARINQMPSGLTDAPFFSKAFGNLGTSELVSVQLVIEGRNIDPTASLVGVIGSPEKDIFGLVSSIKVNKSGNVGMSVRNVFYYQESKMKDPSKLIGYCELELGDFGLVDKQQFSLAAKYQFRNVFETGIVSKTDIATRHTQIQLYGITTEEWLKDTGLQIGTGVLTEFGDKNTLKFLGFATWQPFRDSQRPFFEAIKIKAGLEFDPKNDSLIPAVGLEVPLNPFPFNRDVLPDFRR